MGIAILGVIVGVVYVVGRRRRMRRRIVTTTQALTNVMGMRPPDAPRFAVLPRASLVGGRLQSLAGVVIGWFGGGRRAL